MPSVSKTSDAADSHHPHPLHAKAPLNTLYAPQKTIKQPSLGLEPIQDSSSAKELPIEPFKPAERGQESIRDGRSVIVSMALVEKLILTQLSSREFRVFLAIMADCLLSPYGCSELSAAALQEKTQIDRTHIFGAVKALVENGFLLKEKRDNASANRYQINPGLLSHDQL